MAKIGILYICTGKYSVFWDTFYQSAEAYLLFGKEKHYYVFTDDEVLKHRYHNNFNITFINQKKLGWPLDTLLRFDMFVSIEDMLKEMEYLFFFNANMEFTSAVGDEILPKGEESELTAVLHPGYYRDSRLLYPIETNKMSLAYLPRKSITKYYMGGLNGGSTDKYLELCHELKRRIAIDLSKGFVARWHDESHLNCYLAGRDVHVLGPEYGCPEGKSLKSKHPKIIIRDKSKYGGHSMLRETNTHTSRATIQVFLKRAVVWSFRTIYRLFWDKGRVI